MNTHLQTALHLVGLGFLGVIASNVSGGIIFGLTGYVAFLFAAAIGVAMLIRAARDASASRETPPVRTTSPARARQPYSSL